MAVIRLKTLEEVHQAILPKEAKMRFIDFEALVELHGTYHQFGKWKLMSDRDVDDLIRLTAVRHRRPLAPSPSEAGLVVFIGHPYDHSALIFIGWAPLGQELDLLDRLKEGAQERLMVLNTINGTPADAEIMKQRHKKAWRFGNWFGRTEALIGDINRLTDEPIEGDEFEQLPEEAGRESREAENSRV